ncbi:hypothetical protein BMS3Abin07_00442 [bacterium BMS3Abin07]|nr:hypothetical protein BMS3Abin07_00442 [bacterium BMS3Abin07]GBE32747.1 hypothetical protein BMS3Bbin05_01666 [bacterium BMS3Bbin05]
MQQINEKKLYEILLKDVKLRLIEDEVRRKSEGSHLKY